MKRIVYLVTIVTLAMVSCTMSSCIKLPMYYVDHSGILTYNRQTGQLEFVWEYKGAQDSAKIDSLKK